MKRRRQAASYLILLITAAVFIYYSYHHRSIFHSLSKLNPLEVIGLLLLYFVSLIALALVLKYTLEIWGKKIEPKNNILLNAYSSIINFFGPLQSGPGFRAVYLKKKYDLTYKRFLVASLLYYLFFAIISAFMALVGSSYWRWLWLYVPCALVALLIFRWRGQKNLDKEEKKKIIKSKIIGLALATLLQLASVAVIYFIELRIVNHSTSFTQAISYTGIANFAAFVALTPGSIGIRESFLLLSKKIHHIAGANVVAASVIDRGVYLVYLGILAVVAVSLHLDQKFKTAKSIDPEQSDKP